MFGGQICLDPASSSLANEYVRALAYFDGENADGLEMPWTFSAVSEWLIDQGISIDYPNNWNVFLNPPYGRRNGKKGPYNMPLWVDKIMSEYARGNIDEAIMLVNVFPAQSWFKPLWKCPICFVDHRINFILPETGMPKKDPTQASAFIYMGPNHIRFWKVFSKFGPIVRAMDDDRIPEWILYDSIERK